MEMLFDYLCAIWMLVGCLFGLLVIGAFVKMFIDLFKRRK